MNGDWDQEPFLKLAGGLRRGIWAVAKAALAARSAPQRAVRNEPTPATDKRPAARRVFGEKAVWLRCSSVEDPPGIFSFVAPDTVSRVIRPSARRAHESSPQPMVNNSAAKNDLRPVNVNAGRIALRGSRSFAPRL